MSSIADRLQSVTPVAPAPTLSGRWFNIRVCPDLALGEMLNVGVGYVDSASEKIHIKLADRFDRFRSLYGEEFEDELRIMLHVLDSTIGKGTRQSPFPNIRFSELKFAAGNSVEEILDRLYQATVPTVPPLVPGDPPITEVAAGE